jgi:hypothetical protein
VAAGEIMGENLLYSEAKYVTELQYDLRGFADTFTDKDFERVHAAVVKWSDVTDVSVKVSKTVRGFKVAITHPLKDGHPFGISLSLHLSAGVLRQLEDENKRLALSIIDRKGINA